MIYKAVPSLVSFTISPFLKVVIRIGDEDSAVVEVGGDDEGLGAPVHHGQGLRLPPLVEAEIELCNWI